MIKSYITSDIGEAFESIKDEYSQYADDAHKKGLRGKKAQNEIVARLDKSSRFFDSLESIIGLFPQYIAEREPMLKKYHTQQLENLSEKTKSAPLGKYSYKQYLTLEIQSVNGVIKNLEIETDKYITESEVDNFIINNQKSIVEFFKKEDPDLTEFYVLKSENEARFFKTKLTKNKSSKRPITLDEEIDSEIKTGEKKILLRESPEKSDYYFMFKTRLKRSFRELDKIIDYLLGLEEDLPKDMLGAFTVFQNPKLMYSELEKIRSRSIHNDKIQFVPEYRPLSDRQKRKLITEKNCDISTLSEYTKDLEQFPFVYDEEKYKKIVNQAIEAYKKILISKNLSKEEKEILKAKAIPGIWVKHIPRDQRNMYIESIIQTTELYDIYTGPMSHKKFYNDNRKKDRNSMHKTQNCEYIAEYMRPYLEDIFPSRFYVKTYSVVNTQEKPLDKEAIKNNEKR